MTHQPHSTATYQSFDGGMSSQSTCSDKPAKFASFVDNEFVAHPDIAVIDSKRIIDVLYKVFVCKDATIELSPSLQSSELAFPGVADHDRRSDGGLCVTILQVVLDGA